MTGAKGDEPVIAFEIIQAVWNGDSLSQTRPVVIKGRHHGLRRERTRTIKITDQFFFLVSMLMTGLAAAR